MKHGGKRPNAGPKYKYGEPTKRMSIPLSMVAAIEKKLKLLESKTKYN